MFSLDRVIIDLIYGVLSNSIWFSIVVVVVTVFATAVFAGSAALDIGMWS